MARYTGPRSKVARRFNEPIFGPSKALQRKPHGPGQHGRGRKRKQSEYAVQLGEKQKVKYIYGVLERQFRTLFEKASRKGGITGHNLLRMLESRLDNVVYRLGISPTRRGARQIVLHKHITVNGQLVNIPSFQVKPGDVVSVRESSKALENIVNSVASRAGSNRFSWLEWNSSDMAGTYITYPERDAIPENINEQLIVELYSK
jgi:small subunit ribosomal protein S4